MRIALFPLILAVALPAVAAEHRDAVAMPADVMAVADLAAPKSELAAWTQALARFGVNSSLPTLDALPPLLGGFVGAPRLDGLDFARPLHLVMMNPSKYPHPVLLVPVRDLRALKASASAAKLTVQPFGHYAVVGDAAAVALAGDFLRTRSTIVPRGLHATVYLQPIWTTFGPLLRMAVAAQTSAPATPAAGQPASPVTPEMMAKASQQLFSLLEQGDQFAIDLFGGAKGIGLTLTLDVKPGTPLDTVFSAQHASDFAMLGKLPNETNNLLAAGIFDMSLFKDWVFDFMMSKDKPTEQQRASWNEFCAVLSGDIAMVGQMDGTGQFDAQTLMAVRDSKRAAELFPIVSAAFDKTSMMQSFAKVARKLLPPATYDGLAIGRQQIEYDFDVAKLPQHKGPAKQLRNLSWTTFDGALVSSMSTGGADPIDSLIDSARHGKLALQLDGAAKTSLDEARKLKDSFWMRFDLTAIIAAQAKQTGQAQSTPIPTLLPTVGVGFQPHRIRIRTAL